MPNLQLEGQIDDSSARIRELEDQLAELRKDYRTVENDAITMAGELEKYKRVIRALRDYLHPYKRLLDAVWGEVDLVAESLTQTVSTSQGTVTATVSTSPVASVWESWIDKLGRGTVKARIIAALLTHGAMSQVQVRVAAKAGQSSIATELPNLMRLGLVQKNGSHYSLKEMPRG